VFEEPAEAPAKTPAEALITASAAPPFSVAASPTAIVAK
jgi:hypothetical protein